MYGRSQQHFSHVVSYFMMDTPKNIFLVVTLVLYVIPVTYAGRILLHASQQVSHVQEQLQAGAALRRRGHEVFCLLDAEYPQVGAITAAGVTPVFYWEPPGVPSFMRYNAAGTDNLHKDAASEGFVIVDLVKGVCERMLGNDTLMEELRSLNLDLVIVDGFLLHMCNFALPAYLKVPYVYLSSGFSDLSIGNPALPSVTPSLLGKSNQNMTFMEKVENIFLTYLLISMMACNEDRGKFDKYTNGRSLVELITQSQLFIIPRDHILEWPVPSAPNIVRVPALSVKATKELPPNLKKIVNNSRVIAVVSFGSAIDDLAVVVLQKFFKAMSAFPKVTFIFKLKQEVADALHDVPDNIVLLPWLPQLDLLAEEKTRLFITHCGNNGQYEAVYHGVPMIGFPLFAEQPHNCFRMEDKHLGVCMDIDTFTTEVLINNIRLILEDPSFRENAKLRSGIMKIQKFPAEIVADHIEVIMKFGGEHLRSIAQDIPTYKLFMLDVLLVFVVAILIILILAYNLVKCVYVKFLTASQKKGKLE